MSSRSIDSNSITTPLVEADPAPVTVREAAVLNPILLKLPCA